MHAAGTFVIQITVPLRARPKCDPDHAKGFTGGPWDRDGRRRSTRKRHRASFRCMFALAVRYSKVHSADP